MHVTSIIDKSNYSSIRAFKRLLIGRGNVFKGDVRIENTRNIHSCYMQGVIKVGLKPIIQNSSFGGEIKIGDHCKIIGTRLSGNISIGDYTSIWGPEIYLYQKLNPLSIGKFCSIARGVNFQEFNHNAKKLTTYFIGKNVFGEDWTNEKTSSGPISVQNDVWIGANAMILSGVVIGNGSIVAGGSVVTKSCPPYSIVGGSPAKVIGYRFDEETIAKLLKIEWWNWDETKLKLNMHLFRNEFNPDHLEMMERL